MRKTLSSRELLRVKPFVIREIEYLHPSGTHITRAIVDHPGAVIIIPRDAQGRIVMVRQYRSSINEFLLEIPAGTREVGEDPLTTAKRELAEEIGRAAAHWEFLGELFPAPGFCNEKQYLYFAEDLSSQSAKGDEDEEIEICALSLEEFDRAVACQEIKDGKTLAAVALARAKGVL